MPVRSDKSTKDLKLFKLKFRELNVRILNTKRSNSDYKATFNTATLDASGFTQQEHPSVFTTRTSLPCVDTPTPGLYTEKYRSCLCPPVLFLPVPLNINLLSKWFLLFSCSGRKLFMHIFLLATNTGHVILIALAMITSIHISYYSQEDLYILS